MDKWVGKIAVVTGASAGIGAAIVVALAREGVTVVGLARRKERVEELAKANKGKIYAVQCDVSVESSISEAFDYIEKTFGGVDILVNNAGVLRMGALFDLTKPNSDYLDTINTNLSGLLLVSRRAFKTMKDREYGYIININSVGGQVTMTEEFVKAGINVYGATKHAVTQLNQIMKFEVSLAQKKIRVSSISPGAVATELDLTNGWKLPGGRRMHEIIPDHLQSEDVADQVVYLLSTKPTVNISELTLEPMRRHANNLAGLSQK